MVHHGLQDHDRAINSLSGMELPYFRRVTMRITISLLLVLSLAVFSAGGCKFGSGEKIKGSGNISERSFDVSVGIAFSMMITVVSRDYPGQLVDNVTTDIRIGVFVDRYAGSSVRDIADDQPRVNS